MSSLHPPHPPSLVRIKRDAFSVVDKHPLSNIKHRLTGIQSGKVGAKARKFSITRVAAPSDPNLSQNTNRAYRSDLAHFTGAGGKVPCDAAALVNYLESVGEWFSVATITRRLMAIRHAHVERGLRSPTSDPAVRQAMRALRRQRGTAQKQAKPLTRKLLRKIVCAMDHSLFDRRDRALLLLGFAGGFRRSELVALNLEDIERMDAGVQICIRRSKTDQMQRGRMVAIPAFGGSLCPVAALERWLKTARIAAGPIFRSFDRGGGLTEHRLGDTDVSRIVKKRLMALDVDPRFYSAHSLRAGLVTEAARAGVAGWRIRTVTGHASDATLARYIREAELWAENPVWAAFGKRRGIQRRERVR